MKPLADIADLVRMSEMRRVQGFTLVELLVVMMIIGMLAAISIPTLTSQREKAARAAMASDLHTLRLAQESRSVDNDPRYTRSLALLRQEGYVQSSGVSEPHVSLSNGDNEFVACVTHTSVSEWLVYRSADSSLDYVTEACAPPAT